MDLFTRQDDPDRIGEFIYKKLSVEPDNYTIEAMNRFQFILGSLPKDLDRSKAVDVVLNMLNLLK